MTIIHPGAPQPLPGNLDIASGATVNGGTWSSVAALMNNLTARGGQLVVSNTVNLAITSGATSVLRYYVHPRLVSRHRVWVIYATAAAGTRATLTISEGTETAAAHRVGVITSATGVPGYQTLDYPAPIFHTSTITPTATPGEAALSITASGNNVFVYSVACFEVPRTRLLIGSTDNPAANTDPGSAIYQADEFGLYGLAQAAEAGRNNFIRSNFHWWLSTGFTTTSTSYTPVFTLPPTALGRKGSIVDGATIDVTVAARLVVVGAATGELRVTAASGDTVTLSTTSTTPAWVTGTLSIDREDLGDTDSGGQTGRLYGDALTFELRRTGGTSASVTGLGVGEPT